MFYKTMLSTFALTMLCASSGCRICTDCGDLDYAAYGGAWQRTVRDGGRVASLFDPGGAQASSISDRDDPLSIDAAQRKRDTSSIGDDLPDDEEETPDDSDVPDANERQERDPDAPLPSLDDLEDLQDDRFKELEDLDLDDIEVRTLQPNRRVTPS